MNQYLAKIIIKQTVLPYCISTAAFWILSHNNFVGLFIECRCRHIPGLL